MSVLNEFLPLVMSVIALAISAYNFYAQQFRKRDKLIGHLISVFVNEGEFNTLSEYSVANIGDTQLLIKAIEVLCSDGGPQAIIKSSCAGIPCVLKPGEIALLGVTYNREEIDEHVAKSEDCFFEFEVLSPKGVDYLLPHHFEGKEIEHEMIWKVFELEEKHAVGS